MATENCTLSGRTSGRRIPSSATMKRKKDRGCDSDGNLTSVKVTGSLVLLLFTLAGLATWADGGKSKGTLVDGDWGGWLYALDLSDGSHASLVRWPSKSVTGLSRIDAHRLLVSYRSRKAANGRYWLAIYDLRSNELRDLVKGSKGVYLAEQRMIAYYTGYAGKHLQLADLSGRAVGVVDVDGDRVRLSRGSRVRKRIRLRKPADRCARCLAA